MVVNSTKPRRLLAPNGAPLARKGGARARGFGSAALDDDGDKVMTAMLLLEPANG